jgi:hypothetical protein
LLLFTTKKKAPYGKLNQCKECSNRLSKKYYNPYKYKNASLQRKYGISIEEYNKLLMLQNNSCSICKTSTPNRGGLFVVDHNHFTGEVRGILCNNCNVSLGLAGDSIEVLEAMIRYLETNGQYNNMENRNV